MGIFVFVLLVLNVIYSVESLRQTDFNRVSQIITNFISQSRQTDTIRGKTNSELLRWIFHDAGTFDPRDGSGGAHACLAVPCATRNQCEFMLDVNNGLQSISQRLTRLYQSNQLDDVLSMADFCHLAGKLAVESASGGSIRIGYRWGRTDCQFSVPLFAGRLPNAEGGASETTRVLKNRLGFSDREVVCLLGGHSLGGARRENTGYFGQWTKNPAQFSNAYYSELKDHLWNRMSVAPVRSGFPTKHQWGEPGQPGHMMLNVDIDLFWESRNSNCNVTQNRRCPLASTSDLVETYASSNSRFLADFAAVFQKLSEFGGDSLRSVCSDNDRSSRCSFP